MNVEFVLKDNAVLEYENISNVRWERSFIGFDLPDKSSPHINLDYVISFTVSGDEESSE